MNLIALAMLTWATVSANSQSEPSAWLTIANSTDATLTVTIERQNRRGTITLAPISERRIVAPAGYVTLTAIAHRSAPVLSHQQSFTLSNGGNYTMNLTPAHFGTSYMADRPSSNGNGSGITTNTSRQAQLSRPDPRESKSWLNLGCYNYFRDYVASNSRHIQNGGRQATFVGAFDASSNKYRCEIANTYGDWAVQDANLMKKCREKLGSSANTCEVWKRWRYN